ncbi:MAG: DUF4422 domain-containing protein [Lachnospiraceae bacterium]|nr:DUF4422 domain-containing protein [Lachnospiraceae bacterium]
MRYIIFGAQGYAIGAYEAIKALYSKWNIVCFMVSKMTYNPDYIRGIPVLELTNVIKMCDYVNKKDIDVIIATPDDVQNQIEETLIEYGFKNIQRLDSTKWADLVGEFHLKNGDFKPLYSLKSGSVPATIKIYAARFHKDKELKSKPAFSGNIIPIQVGTEGSDVRIAECCDNEGSNISAKNNIYSELTGLYWIWKHCLCNNDNCPDYYGLGHYRRLLEFSDEDLTRLTQNDVDVVLPYPLPYEPNIHEHHKRYLKDEDWNTLLRVLSEFSTEYAEIFPVVLEQRYLYNYNVILAKKEVLKDYCEWLFPILERVEENSNPKGSERNDRYLGYMAESLETLYFVKNKSKYNIVHTGCRMFV